ncbi:DUF5709 domain-containing protein [Pseudonocardia spinosispora]|uniref:DUF5709 domain-containing protein n=1 Tax=Pseudonocardia spinosispora TaxID=103441 RepID=UPI0004084E47|nr:DUF5709 domain-containing protein [Pseudonocardia spinosispora]
MDPDEVDDDVFEQLDGLDTLDGRGTNDPLDEGYSPPEKPWAVEDWGTTAREEAEGEDLDHRLAREQPESWANEDPDDDGLGDESDTDGELRDFEVGDVRSGRLTASDSGDHEPYAEDVGIDGAAASAEEAAVHVVPDPE